MTDDTLERLLIDRSLGALPTDVDALLTEYLRSRPDAAGRVRELELLIGMTRQVLAARTELPSPSFPLEQGARRWRTLTQSGSWRAATLAACLLIGIGLGALITRHERDGAERLSTQPPSPRPVAVESNERENFVMAAPSEPADAFWSANKLIKGAPRGIGRSSAALQWTSPVSSPFH